MYPYSKTHEFWDELGKCWYDCHCLDDAEMTSSMLPHRMKEVLEPETDFVDLIEGDIS